MIVSKILGIMSIVFLSTGCKQIDNKSTQIDVEELGFENSLSISLSNSELNCFQPAKECIVAIDKFWTNGNLKVILDREVSGSVLVYDSVGSLTYCLRSDRHNPTSFSAPLDIAVDAVAQQLFVLDDFQPRIQIYDLRNGTYIGKIALGTDIHCIEVLDAGLLIMYNNTEAIDRHRDNATLYLYDVKQKKVIDYGYWRTAANRYLGFYSSNQVFFPFFSSSGKGLLYNEGINDTVFSISVSNGKIKKSPFLRYEFGDNAITKKPPGQIDDAIAVLDRTSSLASNFLLAYKDKLVANIRFHGKPKYLVSQENDGGFGGKHIVNTIHLIVDGETLPFEAYLLSTGHPEYYYCTLLAEMASYPMFEKSKIEQLLGKPIDPNGAPIVFLARIPE